MPFFPRKPEIMSPAGYWPQLHATIEAGTDAVYFGLTHFSARAKVGFTLTELPDVMRTCTSAESRAISHSWRKIIKEQGNMSTIHFEAKLFKINSWIILRLPESASAKLPSRGMTMVSGTINGAPFKALLEPDGRYAPGKKPSHWFRPDEKLLYDARAVAGDTVQVSLEPTKEWIEPEVPEDLKEALATSPKAEALWSDITPLARWDWIRWIRAVKTPETRQKHIEVALDKLNKGMRRPCCFNRNLCSEPYVSHNWVLLSESGSD